MLECEVVSNICWHPRRFAGYRSSGFDFIRLAVTQIATFLIIPRGLVILHGGSIVSGVEAVFRKLETLLHDESGIGVVHQVIVGDAVFLNGIADEATEERDVGACTD